MHVKNLAINFLDKFFNLASAAKKNFYFFKKIKPPRLETLNLRYLTQKLSPPPIDYFQRKIYPLWAISAERMWIRVNTYNSCGY